MLESIENAVQVVVLFCCIGFALFRSSGKNRTGAWVCLIFFFGSRLLGDLYWQACLFYFGETPEVALVPDLSWYASILFQYLLVRMEIGTEKPVFRVDMSVGRRRPIRTFLPYLAPVYTFANAVLYMHWGKYVSNIIYAVLMGLVLFVSLRGLLEERTEGENGRGICLITAVICFLDYGAWTASCFWDKPVMEYAYYGFDTLITICFPLLIPVVSRLNRQTMFGAEVMKR